MNLNHRIGAYIGYKRRRLYKLTKSQEYTQSGFIKATNKHSLYNCPVGMSVCARSTLVKIENGLVQSESQLLQFFLQKLGCEQKLLDDSLLREDKILNHYLDDKGIEHFLDWYDDFKKEINTYRHHLIVFDIYALKLIHVWINTNNHFNKSSVLHALDILNMINPKLKHLLIEFICLEVYFNREYWFLAQSIIDRFKVLNINTNTCCWFIKVFKQESLNTLIDFPVPSLTHRYDLQVEKYNWYLKQPHLIDINTLRTSLSFKKEKYSKYLKHEPYPFSLSLAISELN